MEEAKTCESCRHFRRHYVRIGNQRYMPLDAGHCVHPRLKNRTVKTPACQNYRGQKEQEACPLP